MLGRLSQVLLAAMLCSAGAAQALTAQDALAVSVGETDTRIEAINRALADADDKTVALLQALSDEVVKVAGDKVFIVRDDKAVDAVSGQDVPLPEVAEDTMVNNRLRGELDTALASIRLFAKDLTVRAAAVRTLQGETDESKLPLIEKALASEKDGGLRDQLEQVRGAIMLGSTDAAKRLDAARLLAQGKNRDSKTVLLNRLRVEDNPQVKAALQTSLAQVEDRLA